MLVTDGGANCAPEAADNNERFEVYDQLLLDAVESAYGEGIPVFVVGIDIVNQTTEMKQDGNPDNVNVYQKLNAVAVAGGRPKNDPNEKFYQTTNQLDLKAAVSMIADQLMTCEVALGSAPTFPDLVELSIDGQTYPSNDALDCVGEDGWIYTSPDHTQLELCGEACARFKSAGVVDVTLGCPE